MIRVCLNSLLHCKGHYFGEIFTLITLTLCPISQSFFRATNAFIKLKVQKSVVYFLKFCGLDLLSLTVEPMLQKPEVMANSHLSLERRCKNSPWPLNRKLYKVSIKKDDNNGNIFQSDGILVTNNHFKSH